MRHRFCCTVLGFAVLILAGSPMTHGKSQAASNAIKTNKDQMLTIAVQGKIAPAEPGRSYTTTWDGKPKMAIGTGGINYNLQIGDRIFGWAGGDRATMGVATVGVGEARFQSAWGTYASIGNEVRILEGEAKGSKGTVIGKFGSYVLIHFPQDILHKLTIGTTVQAKTCGLGLKIQGFDEVLAHGIAPEVLERLVAVSEQGRLEAPVVKRIPAEIVGQGAGRGSLSGNWHIQTCFPPDIEKYGLDELRFGDLVLLQDIQTDYGMGYYRGGATLGVVCSGPSDISGLGIGVTPILSTRTDILTARIDPAANLTRYLGLNPETGPAAGTSGVFKTNKDRLIATAVEGVVQPAGSSGYSMTYDGKPKIAVGMASINYSVSLGDPAYGWASADHVEPDVTIQGRDQERPSDCALAILSCIGNEARVISGDARGAKGFYIGRHAGSDDLVWFPKHVLDQLALNDRIQVTARGVGLRIEGFEDVRVNKLSPELLENMGISLAGSQLVVPIVMEVPGFLMGSGIGGNFLEPVDYDIQTTCPEVVEELGLKKLKLGDVVAIRNHYDFYGRGRYEGAVTIGVIIHGWSDYAGHGPGVNPVLSALPGKIKTRIDPDANTVYYLGIREKPAR